MGLIKAAFGSVGGVLADQWKEYFYCESLDTEVLAAKGEKRTSKRSSNTRGSENIISDGSVIAVADGQCMLIVEQGKVVDVCAEPGEYTYDVSTEPSIFTGDLGDSVRKVFQNVGKRFTFGGEPPRDQRIYYINTKELIGNKYGTPSPVPFRVVDANVGLDMDITIRCFGEYSYRIVNPLLFYTNICGNVEDDYKRENLDGQLKTELMTALQPAFAKISAMGIRYSALPGHTMELANALNEVLTEKWRELRGIEIVSFGVSSVKASDEDEAMIKELQRNAAFRNPNMAAAHLVGAQAEAMQAAAKNEGGMGAMGAFMGMNMAGMAGGMNAQGLYGMGQQFQGQPGTPAQGMQQPSAQGEAAANGNGSAVGTSGQGWSCSCGARNNTGKFCVECGAKKPEAPVGWTCPSCGTVNKGNFCGECGAKKPENEPLYQCDQCGWEPEDPKHPPKFCPECGDPFDDGDRR